MKTKEDELIPPPDFKRTHVTNYVLEQDRKTLARIEQARKMREPPEQFNKFGKGRGEG